MSEASVLKRKLAPPLEKALADCTVETLLRKTMPRDADKLCGLDLIVDDVSFSETDKSSVIEALAEAELVYQLQNAKGAGGLCVVSPELLAGLIEVQLYGYVTKAEIAERKPTRTDGSVVSALVDAWMSTAEAVAAQEDQVPMPFMGFRRKDGILDQRNAGLLMEPGRYAQMTVKMTLGDDAKSGMLRLMWPDRRQSSRAPERFSKRLSRHLAQLNAPMRVVLTQLPLPMERVRDLKVDEVIDVPVEALVSVKLEGVDGTPITTGRLGQINGMRAVRLNLSNEQNQMAALVAPDVTLPGAAPDMAELTTLPDVTSVPEPVDLPDLPDLPSIDGDLPDLPDLPDAGGLPDLPDIGDLPDLPDAGTLPDLPDIGDLSDLPDLPDLP